MAPFALRSLLESANRRAEVETVCRTDTVPVDDVGAAASCLMQMVRTVRTVACHIIVTQTMPHADSAVHHSRRS
jgi:hypothetical protein